MSAPEGPLPPVQVPGVLASPPSSSSPKPPPHHRHHRRLRRQQSWEKEVTALIQAQLDHCKSQGAGVRKLGPPLGRVQLSLPFAGRKLEVLAILHQPPPPPSMLDDDEEEESWPPRCPYPDIIPLWGDGPEAAASSSSSSSSSSPYQVCSLERLLPCLRRWCLSRREALWEVAVQAREAYSEAQRGRLQGLPDGSERFNLEMLSHVPGVELQCGLTNAGYEASVLLPLWGQAGQEEANGVGSPLAKEVKVGLLFRWLGAEAVLLGGSSNSSSKPEVTVSVPEGLPVTKRLASWAGRPQLEAGGDASEFLERLRRHLYEAWERRRELVRVLGATYGLLEYDGHDFSHVHLLTRVKRRRDGARPALQQSFVLGLSLGPDFPASAPSMVVTDLSRGPTPHSLTLDRTRYRYSPRWDAKRMAQELYDHAIAAILAEASLWPAPAPPR